MKWTSGFRLGTDLPCNCKETAFPDNPEAGFGALPRTSTVIENAGYWLAGETFERIKKEQIAEIERRINALRGGKPLPDIAGRTVILVDDGIAMGSTMRAAIELCRNKKAKKIVVAVPVAGKEIADVIAKEADEIVVLETLPVSGCSQVENW